MTEKITNILGITLAFLAKPCCVFPIILSIFGLSSTSLVAVLHPYKWFILSSAVMSFSVSAFFTFRQGISIFTKFVWFISIFTAILFWLFI